MVQGPVQAVSVVEGLELAQSVEEVSLVPDPGAVQQFAPAGLYPSLHHEIHPGHLDAAGDELQPIVEEGLTNGREWSPFAFPFNLTGQPAASLPVGITSAGLPVGLQLVGKRPDDGTVLHAAHALERALAGHG